MRYYFLLPYEQDLKISKLDLSVFIARLIEGVSQEIVQKDFANKFVTFCDQPEVIRQLAGALLHE